MHEFAALPLMNLESYLDEFCEGATAGRPLTRIARRTGDAVPTSGDLPYPPADGRGQRQWGNQAVWHEALVPGWRTFCIGLLFWLAKGRPLMHSS